MFGGQAQRPPVVSPPVALPRQQSIRVTLYANGAWQQTATNSVYTADLGRGTNCVRGSCGVPYQTATTHAVSGYATTTWSPGFYLC